MYLWKKPELNVLRVVDDLLRRYILMTDKHFVVENWGKTTEKHEVSGMFEKQLIIAITREMKCFI